MAAPEGNTNAEVWTEEEAIRFGNDVLALLEGDESCRTIEKACVTCGKYETVFDYLATKYPIVFEPIKKRAKAIAKSRLIEQSLEGKVNTTMAIFVLKNNHEMRDSQNIDHTTKGEAIGTKPDLTTLTDDELRTVAALQRKSGVGEA